MHNSNLITCFFCGSTNDKDANYCRECGHRIPLYYKCIHCQQNTKIFPAKYCQHCGKEINITKNNCDELLLMPFIENNCIGYIDFKTNLVYVAPQFHYGRMFSDGIAAVRIKRDSRWSFINKYGETISKEEYYDCGAFDNNLVIVQTSNGWGVINRDAEIIIPFIYKKLTRNNDGYFHRQIDKLEVLFDQEGSVIFQSEEIRIYDFMQTGGFISQFGVIKVYNRNTGKFGLIDIDGKLILSPYYDEMSDFSEGYCAVSRAINGEEKWGFINLRGEECITCQYEDVDNFCGGVAIFQVTYKDIKKRITPKGKKISYYSGYRAHGLINTSGDEILDANDYFLFGYSDGLIKCQNIEDETGFLNANAQVVIPCKFSRATSFKRGISIAVFEGKVGIIDNYGNTLVPFQFDILNDYFSSYNKYRTNDDLIIVRKNEKYGVINKIGEWIISNEYDDISICYDYFIVKKNNKYGLINNLGDFIVPLVMDRITEVYNRCQIPLFRVTRKISDIYYISGIVDSKGIFRIPLKYNHIGDDNLGISNFNGNSFSKDPRPNFIVGVSWKENDINKSGIVDLFGNMKKE